MLALIALGACASPPPPTTIAALAEGAGASAANAPAEFSWDVDVARDWTMTQRVCFRGSTGGARTIAFVMPEAQSALKYARASDGNGGELPITARGVVVPAGAECVLLTIDLGRAARELDDNDKLTMFGDALWGTPDQWLWRPEPWPKGARGTLTLRLPEGVRASVPWKADERGRYIVDASTWRMMCKFAFGDIDVRTVDVGEARFTIARLPGAVRATDKGIERWLRGAAGAVSLVNGGRFPVRHAQILIVPVDGGFAIPFGMAVRGGGPTAMMLLSKRADDEDIYGEWVGVHELSHLLLPPVNRGDAWLSEGLASYYQQTLRGRHGLLTVDEAWGELVDGFDRGKAKTWGDDPLSRASERMFTDFSFVRVYWGGAAIMLELDVELRKKGRSLDELVVASRAREPVDVAFRSADEVLGWWAESAPDVDVRGIVRRGLAQPFPDVEPTLAQLGVLRGTRKSSTRAVLVDDAPLAHVRRAILSR